MGPFPIQMSEHEYKLFSLFQYCNILLQLLYIIIICSVYIVFYVSYKRYDEHFVIQKRENTNE